MPSVHVLDEARIMEYLRSGNELSPVDENLVKDEMTSFTVLDTEIGRLEGKIARLNEQLTFLKVQQRERERNSRYLLIRALRAPVRRLPPDVLREIFIHCLLLQPEFCEKPSWRYTPLSLGMLCSLWRRVSIHTPELWSDPSILWERRSDNPRAPGIMALTALWFTRSSNFPLTISIPVDMSIPDNFKTLLLSNTCRFKKLSIGLTYESWLLKDCDLFPYHRLVELTVTNTLTGSTSGHPFDLRLAAPNIKSAKFYTEWTHEDIPARMSVILCWERLSYLLLDSVTAQDTFDILSQCHNLKEMALLFIESDPGMRGLHPDPIVLSKLHSLHYALPVAGVSDRHTYLDHLVLPNLQIFGYSYDSQARGWPETAFLSLVSRSSCVITEFYFQGDGIEIPEQEQIRVVQSLSRLQTFTIYNISEQLEERPVAISPLVAELLDHRGARVSE